MATRSSAVNVEVNVVGEKKESRPEADPDMPFRVAILGDFSGRGNRGIIETDSALKNRGVYPIDRDNFSAVMSRLKVELQISILGKDSSPLIIRVADLDDLHPDRLFENLEVFEALKDTRQSLKDPAAIAAFVKQFDTSATAPEHSVPIGEAEPGGNLLEQILDAANDKPPTGQFRSPSDLDDFVRRIVSPHLVAKTDPVQGELVAKVDDAIGELMRKILHHPDFQALEAAWRGLHFLVSQFETDESLKLFLLDISKAELAGDLGAANGTTSTEIYQLLVKQTADAAEAEPWAVLAGNFIFDQTEEDATLLNGLAKMARALGAPFVAAAHPHLIGCDCLADTPDPDDWAWAPDSKTRQAWTALRQLPEASFVGLALPRFLLRLPYGKDTDPVELTNFEEIETTPPHEHYLWGNPAIVCAYLLAKAFSQYGWNFHPGIIQEIDGLPLHVYKDQGESRLKPCAELLLTQRAAEWILDRGVMPLLSFMHQDIVRLARFQSLADPAAPLNGRWR